MTDQQAGSSQPNVIQKVLAGSSHPTASIFHIAFRLSALTIYIFGGILFPDAIVFILTIVLSAVDFWTVQNVTGRLLVGLKWKCKINEDGTEEWIYEERVNNDDVNKTDKYIFWGGLCGFPIVWVLFFFANLLTFDAFWTMCVAIVMALLAINARGFWRCNKSIRTEMKGMAAQFGTKMALGSLTGSSGGSGVAGGLVGGLLAGRQQPPQQPAVTN